MAPFESTISIGSTIESLANDSDTPKEVDNIGFDYVKFHDEGEKQHDDQFGVLSSVCKPEALIRPFVYQMQIK